MTLPPPAVPLTIRPVDPRDDHEMLDFQRIYEDAERAEFADPALFTLEDGVAMFTRESSSEFVEGYVAFDGEEMVGEGLIIGNRTDNLDIANVFIWVPPQYGRRGVGTQIGEFLATRSRDLGRSVLHGAARYPFDKRDDHPYRRFAEQLGYSLANTEVERRLQLPVATDRLDRLAAEAAPYYQDYRLQSHVGPLPEALLESYCEVLNRLSIDAPRGELIAEERRRTPADIVDQDEMMAAQGRTRVATLAIDEVGRVVAITAVSVPAPSEPHIDQHATIVAPEHRGHRLGMAVKVAQTRVIQQHFPDKRYITTTNAETNAQMVAINEALGFAPYALEGLFQRLLT